MKKQVIKREITTKHTRYRIKRKTRTINKPIVEEDNKKKVETVEKKDFFEEKNNKKNNRKEKNVISQPTPVIAEIIENNNVEETIENHE